MNTLRGVKPSSIKKRFKGFFYGNAGVGKTTAAIHFPAPYLIDTEKGADNPLYTKTLDEVGGVIFQTSDFDEIVQEIKTLLTVDHSYKTLIIDPLTHVYDGLVCQEAIKVGTGFNRHLASANRKMKFLLRLIDKLDMNVIITSHAKKLYIDGEEAGNTFDCYSKMDYVFGIVLEIKKQGSQRIAVVKKTRLEEFEDGSSFPFSYEEIGKKYGEEGFNKKAIPQNLASHEQVSLLQSLIEKTNYPAQSYQQWLLKSRCESFDEMNGDNIQKCIDFLISKTMGDKNAIHLQSN